MERRKLIKLGNSSFAIALPKAWITKSGLKKGDEIFLERTNTGELILSQTFKKANEPKGVSIDLSGKDISSLWREINAAYVKGYTLFHLKGNGKKNEDNPIKKILDGLLGIEIAEKNKEGIIAKDFFNLEEANIENFIRRMDNNVRSMFDIATDGIKKRKLNRAQLNEIEDADSDINKFYLFISRIFSLGSDNPSVLAVLRADCTTLFHYWWLAYNLEHVGDDIKSIAKILVNSQLNEKLPQSFLKLFLDMQNVYTNSIDSFYKRDKNMALKNASEGRKVWQECDKLTKNADVSIVKLATKLKEIEKASYQNSKMVMYMAI